MKHFSAFGAVLFVLLSLSTGCSQNSSHDIQWKGDGFWRKLELAPSDIYLPTAAGPKGKFLVSGKYDRTARV